jgi:hypothetical protein
MVVGDAVRSIVGPGAGATLTLAEALAVPPVPVHVKTNVASLDSGPTVCSPCVGFEPLQASVATQLSASCADHVMSVDAP